ICPNSRIFTEKGGEGIIENRKINRQDAHLVKCRSKNLMPYWNKWYPNGKKIVPLELKLTPTTVLHWFMGDGTTSFIKNTNRVELTLCTNGFNKIEVIFLKKLLSEINLDLGIYKVTNKNEYR